MQVVEESIYDHPRYYDLIFGSDWVAEFRFLEAVFGEHVLRKTRRLLEPACGTGRLLYRMNKAGYHCEGLDLNEKAVEFCNARLRRHGYRELAWVADMCRFDVAKPFDAAFNTINSFRHLASEASAVQHLRAMAAAIRPGGVYALGFHLTPTVGDTTDEESWTARRGHLQVNTRMWPKDKDPKARIERFHIQFDIHKPTEAFRIDDCLVLRSYTYRQFESLVKKVPEWTIEQAYDFSYNINEPIEIDESTEDIVYILKRS
jgi:SAM-dependent methyltransferase